MRGLAEAARRLRLAGYQYVLHLGSACDYRRKARAQGNPGVPPLQDGDSPEEWEEENPGDAADGGGSAPGIQGSKPRSPGGKSREQLLPGWAGWCLAKGEGGMGEMVRLLSAPPGLEHAADDWITDPEELDGRKPITRRRRRWRPPPMGAESVLFVHMTTVQVEEARTLRFR